MKQKKYKAKDFRLMSVSRVESIFEWKKICKLIKIKKSKKLIQHQQNEFNWVYEVFEGKLFLKKVKKEKIKKMATIQLSIKKTKKLTNFFE